MEIWSLEMKCWIFSTDTDSVPITSLCADVCRCLTYVLICTFTDLTGPQARGSFPWKTNKTNGPETLKRGKNAMSIILVKCMITGYKDASGMAPAGKLVFRNWNACWDMAQRLLSGAAGWKSSKIALGKEWLRKYSLDQKILLGEEKIKEFCPKRRVDSKNANLAQASRAYKNLSTSCPEIWMWRWKEACEAVKIKFMKGKHALVELCKHFLMLIPPLTLRTCCWYVCVQLGMTLEANAGKHTDLGYLGAMERKGSPLWFKKSSSLLRKHPLAICLSPLTPSRFTSGSISICLVWVNNSSCHLMDIYEMLLVLTAHYLTESSWCIMKEILMFPFYTWGNGGLERLQNVHKGTCCWLPSPCSLWAYIFLFIKWGWLIKSSSNSYVPKAPWGRLQIQQGHWYFCALLPQRHPLPIHSLHPNAFKGFLLSEPVQGSFNPT